LQLLLDQLVKLFSNDVRLFELFRSYLLAPRIEAGQLSIPVKGLPTGTSPSNFLANVYLAPLDQAMASLRGRYLRYCDDLLILARTEEEVINSKTKIKDTLATLGLELKASKTVLVSPGGTFVFLGYQFSSGSPKIGPKAIRKFKNNIRRTTRRRKIHRWAYQDLETLVSDVIQAVNEHIIIMGSDSFVYYFSLCDAEEQFRDLDNWILDRVRGVLANSWRRGLQRKFRSDWLRSRDLRSLVNEYHACRSYSMKRKGPKPS
jgi:hypothetical protein